MSFQMHCVHSLQILSDSNWPAICLDPGTLTQVESHGSWGVIPAVGCPALCNSSGLLLCSSSPLHARAVNSCMFGYGLSFRCCPVRWGQMTGLSLLLAPLHPPSDMGLLSPVALFWIIAILGLALNTEAWAHLAGSLLGPHNAHDRIRQHLNN